MKTRFTVLTMLTILVGMAMSFAQDPNIGTWKLNEAKSKFAAGTSKNNTVVYEMAGDSIKASIDGVDGQGKAFHSEWTGKFDGKDYAVTGDPVSDTRSINKIDDHHLDLTVKKDGKVTATGKLVVAADGKSRTLTVNGTDSKGKKTHSLSVYDKQ
jgi:hypothetical protein